MKQTIEERAYKAVPDMLRINDNYIASFVSGYCRGAIEERAEIKEYLEKKKAEKSLGNPIEEYGMGFKDGIDYILDEILDELFKK